MTNRIKSSSKPLPSVISASKRLPSVEKARVVKAIGAKASDTKSGEHPGGPPAIFGLRQEIYQRLRSTGGRRSLAGAVKRQKIPLLEGDWERLQEVAQASRTEAVRPTPAQVASVLLHDALDQLERGVNSGHVARARKR